MKHRFEPFPLNVDQENQKNLSFLEYIQRNHDALNELAREVTRIATQLEHLNLEIGKISEIVRYTHEDMLELKAERAVRASLVGWFSNHGWPIVVAIMSVGAFVWELKKLHGV